MLQNHFIGNKASEINKISFWYFYCFYWNFVCLFASFAIENFKLESYCFERNNRIWCLNGYDFESYQTTSHKKNYHNRLSNSTTFFVVYKWPLRIETVVIKLNEIKVYFSAPLRYRVLFFRVPVFRFSRFSVPCFHVFCRIPLGSHQGSGSRFSSMPLSKM